MWREKKLYLISIICHFLFQFITTTNQINMQEKLKNQNQGFDGNEVNTGTKINRYDVKTRLGRLP